MQKLQDGAASIHENLREPDKKVNNFHPEMNDKLYGLVSQIRKDADDTNKQRKNDASRNTELLTKIGIFERYVNEYLKCSHNGSEISSEFTKEVYYKYGGQKLEPAHHQMITRSRSGSRTQSQTRDPTRSSKQSHITD